MTATLFEQSLCRFVPYKSYWNYEDGCLLLGCARLFQATGQHRYAAFVLDYLRSRVTPSGDIPSYLTDAHSLDSFHCSKLLFFADRQTHDPRYRAAIRWQAGQIGDHPRTKSGLCWHKGIYPQQVWIDGVYMTAPFYAQFAAEEEKECIYIEIERWFRYLYDHLRDPETGLYYHALDEARVQPWADPQTGLSPTHWLRGEGWFLMALADTAALLPETHPLRALLGGMLREALDAILAYQSPDGLLYQVIDRPELPGNYPETSGTLMTAYALMEGARLGLLAVPYFAKGERMLAAVKERYLTQDADGVHLGGICKAAGLGGTPNRDGSPAYYLSEPVVADDPKGVGVLMLAEAARLLCQKGA